jgi:transposase-like protein
MTQRKRIRRSAAVWRQLFARQSNSGMSVSEFCKREGINASFFRSWRVKLRDGAVDGGECPGAESAMPMPAPFIDLGDLRSDGPRFEVRLELGAGVILSIARG